MAFLSNYFWGVKIWIWLYLMFSFSALLFVLISFFKEEIRKFIYSTRYPEKLIKIVMHYPSNIYKEFWRLILESEFFELSGHSYKYDEKKLIKDYDIFAKLKKGKKEKSYYITINGKDYEIDELKAQKYRWRKYPEIHYFFNNPNPIDFNATAKKADISAILLNEFKENDL